MDRRCQAEAQSTYIRKDGTRGARMCGRKLTHSIIATSNPPKGYEAHTIEFFYCEEHATKIATEMRGYLRSSANPNVLLWATVEVISI